MVKFLRLAMTGLVAIMLLPIAAMAQPRADEPQRDPYAGLDAIVAQVMAEDAIPGLSLAIVDGDRVIVRGYGVREVGADAPVDADTAFAYGSLAKPFIALGLNMLQEEGALSLDDPIRDHIPAFAVADPYVTAHATIRDALAHRTGTKRSDFVWFGDPRASFDLVLERMQHLAQAHTFRGGFEYSNLMYGVAEHVLAANAGVRADRFMKQRIFDPLGMKTMTMDSAELAAMRNVAIPHAPTGTGIVTIPSKTAAFGYQSVTGPFFGSARDGAQWLRFLLGRASPEAQAILSRAALEASWHRITPIADRGGFAQALLFEGATEVSYAQGWFVSDFSGRRALTHLGGADGMASLASFLPERKVGVVVLSNLGGSMARSTLRNWIFARALGQTGDAEVERLQTWNRTQRDALMAFAERWDSARMADLASPVPWHDYIGRYVSPLGGSIAIADGPGDTLIATINSRPPVRLRHWHGSTFELIWELENYNWPIRTLVAFDLDFENRPVSFLIDGGGEQMTFHRAPAD